MAIQIGRREFIATLAGATAWPLAPRAEQSDRMRRIAVLVGLAVSDPEGQKRFAAFRQGLSELGWVDGKNLRTDYRWAFADVDAMREFAKELVELNPELIVASSSSPAVAALMKATATIPIIFVNIIEPVGRFVTSLAHPDGNVTGFTNFEYTMVQKWVEALKEMAPHVKRVALLFNPDTAPYATNLVRPFEVVAASVAVEAEALAVRDSTELAAGIATLGRKLETALIVVPDIFNARHRERIIALSLQYRMPTIYPYRFFAQEGGLMSYGVDVTDIHRRAAVYVDRILRGTKISDLPVQFPTRFELVINLKTARAIGIDVSLDIASPCRRGDRVVQFCPSTLLHLLRSPIGTLRRIRCNAQIRELSEVQRTCHELVGPIGPALMTHNGFSGENLL